MVSCKAVASIQPPPIIFSRHLDLAGHFPLSFIKRSIAKL